MITNELRLGNYIYVNGNNPEIPFHVSKIGVMECEVEGLPFTISSPFVVHQKDIYPIQITNKILERCGFIPSDFGFTKNDDFHFNNRTVIIGGSDFDNKFWRNLSVQVDVLNLHQLQNIYYAVTGQELELNTEKW